MATTTETPRSVTINGTAGNDIIGWSYVDRFGVAVSSLSGNDATQTVGDTITIRTGGGSDDIILTQQWLGNRVGDNIRIDAGSGNDLLQLTADPRLTDVTHELLGSLDHDHIVYRGGGRATLNGGAGDDLIEIYATVQPRTHAWAWPVLTGGEGRDRFVVSGQSGLNVQISDYTLTDWLYFTRANGERVLFDGFSLYRNNYFTAQDSAGGLVVQFRDPGTALMLTATLPGITLSKIPKPPANIIDGTGFYDRILKDYVDAEGHGFTPYEDHVLGGLGKDVIHLDGRDSDSAFGGGDDDSIYLRNGKHIAHGDHGDDVIIAFRGRQTVFGDAGDDRLAARLHGSTVHGGDGNDSLRADAFHNASHVLTGGAGHDSFLIVSRDDGLRGKVVITDYNALQDDLFIDDMLIARGQIPAEIDLREIAEGWADLWITDTSHVILAGIDADSFAVALS